jgi:hypothetical protein
LSLDKLALLQPSDWDLEKMYDKDPPSYIHSSIEWKLTLNNKVISFKGHGPGPGAGVSILLVAILAAKVG